MGLFDCVASPEGRDQIDESQRPVSRPRPKELSRSDHDISKRRTLPLFASQTSLKNVRDIDFWRQKVVRYLYTPEGREDIRILRVPFQQLGYSTVPDFISAIPAELFQEYEVPPHKGIYKDDKVFWERDGIAEAGIFKWHGIIDDVSCIGLQLDRKKAVPFGIHDGKGLFTCKPGHRALVPATEIIPYKQFLRRYLGLPPKKDSLVGMFGSVRLPEKAIQARNSKAGDRVYLHKEKKYAIVQWIGKIDNEIVVDLVYERSKPEDGKPVSPDEPYISRSVSLVDFINELDSEPNSPLSPGVGTQSLTQTVTATVENQAIATSSKQLSPPPTTANAKSQIQESDHSDVDDTTEDSESEEDDEEDDETESDESEEASDDSGDEIKNPDEPEDPKPMLKTYPEMENLAATDTIDSVAPETEETFNLVSPKRKGFFKFSPKPSKRAKSKPTAVVEKVDSERDLTIVDEVEQAGPPKPPPRSKSPNIFGNFKFGISANKKKKDKKPANIEVVSMEIAEDVPPPRKTKDQPRISKSEEKLPTKFVKKGSGRWGGLFKSKSKNSLKLNVDEPQSPIECSTPLDEMVPPDKIPTPPPKQTTDESYNERKVERPEFLSLPSTAHHLDRSSVQSPLSSPFKSDSSEDKQDDAGQHQTDNSTTNVHVGIEDDSDNEVFAEDGMNGQDPDSPPPIPQNPPPVESDLEEQIITTVPVVKEELVQTSHLSDADTEEDESESEEEPTTEVAKTKTVEPEDERVKSEPKGLSKISTAEATPKDYLERFKESKVRNRPSSFGSFLSRIKNQKRKPDGSLKAPTSPTSPEHPTNIPELETGADDNQSNARNIQDTSENPHGENITVTSQGNEGDQEGIVLDLLDVQESTTPVTATTPTDTSETPKRKAGRGRTFSFTFAKKRKPSNTAPVKDQDQSFTGNVSENETNNENINPIPNSNEQLSDESDKTKKESRPNSFRNSFKRTFSLTRGKKQSNQDLNEEAPLLSPSANNITKPRPVTLYIDNNEAVPKQRNSFRNKRPASIHVDVQPWNTRHGKEGVEVFSPSDETPNSPVRTPNPALAPKQSNTDIPKHRIFTTPAFFHKKSKKTEEPPLTPENSKAPQKFWSSNQDESEIVPSITNEGSSTPVSPQSPPPLPTAPPPVERVKRQPSVVVTETQGEGSSGTLKSALKQRKEIDFIPKGLKINDRVIWYSGQGPIPGTVQRLFKDGTDKYTAMVKFDREVYDEPLRLVREGDAYMITVEELITPDMFGPSYTSNMNSDSPVNANENPITPTTPSVRFDGLTSDDGQTQDDTDSDEDSEGLDIPPPFQEEEVSTACGFRRGIQCQDKSCCLETILFSLFYTTNAFDLSMLYGNTRDEDSVTASTRKILRKEIVDPLRRKGFCDFIAVKKLRDAVKPLSEEWQTLSTDAEVMMFILFDQALKLGKFISYSNDMSDFLHQLEVDSKDLSKSSTVQHLFETSLQLMDKIKLQTVPTPALILEMPRSNDKLVQYKAVIPNLTLHVSHLLNNGPRLCICGMVAKYECTQCSAKAGNMSIVYCDNCKGTADVIHFQLAHETQLSPLNQSVVILDLTAIICVKAGHYFSFVKCGNHKLSPWVYFDGAEVDNPKVCIEQNLGMWLDRLEKYPGKYQDALQYPLLTHILQDSHICIYQPREKSSSV